MTAYEIIMIFLGIIGLLISSCGLLLALLTFLDKKKSGNKNARPVVARTDSANLGI